MLSLIDGGRGVGELERCRPMCEEARKGNVELGERRGKRRRGRDES